MRLKLRRLFSDPSEEENDKEGKRKGLVKDVLVGGTTAAGVGVGGSWLSDKAVGKVIKSVPGINAADDKEMLGKLIEVAKKDGIPTSHNLHYNGAAARINPQTREVMDIVLGGNPKYRTSGVYAHELGHTRYFQGKAGNKLTRGIHNHARIIGDAINDHKKLSSAAYVANGFHSGMKAEQAKKEGKKESLWNKTRAVAVPLAISAPTLIAEGLASRKGYKILKESGASKELLKQTRNQLASAWATYGAGASGRAVMGEGGRIAGKYYQRAKDKREKKKEAEQD